MPSGARDPRCPEDGAPTVTSRHATAANSPQATLATRRPPAAASGGGISTGSGTVVPGFGGLTGS